MALSLKRELLHLRVCPILYLIPNRVVMASRKSLPLIKCEHLEGYLISPKGNPLVTTFQFRCGHSAVCSSHCSNEELG